jgi:hypothetical protein
MVPPESMLLSGSSTEEMLTSFVKANNQLTPDLRRQLDAVWKKYLAAHGLIGACERLNGRTVAQLIAEIPSDEMQSLLQRRFAWQEVRETALTGAAAAVEGLCCPKCRGVLSMRFDPASPQTDGTTAGFLIIRCQKCSAGCCADGLNATPPWVESLGMSIKTEKRG